MHYYDTAGTPRHFVESKSGDLRPTRITDARKHGWLPSPTTVLSVLAKEGLVRWRIEQAVMCVLTAPRKDGEDLDAFVERVLYSERQQDAESEKAKDLGTEIHNALECHFTLKPYDLTRFNDYIAPVVLETNRMGTLQAAEKVLVGDGYAGKTDLILEGKKIWVVDYKTCKKLPKESWPEHKLQLSAYAAALGNAGNKQIVTANIYISTTEPGKIVVCENGDWQETFTRGFKPLLDYWCFANNYKPELKEAA